MTWLRASGPSGGRPKSRCTFNTATGQRAANKHLKRQGLKFLTANFRSPRGEIDLVFRDGDCLLFIPFDINHNR